MEAGGIEPPSESLQHKASTCLSHVFNLAPGSSHGQDISEASLVKSRRTAPRHESSASLFNDVSFYLTDGIVKQTVTGFKPLQRTHNRWRLCICRFFTGQRLPVHATLVSLLPSKPNRPLGLKSANLNRVQL